MPGNLLLIAEDADFAELCDQSDLAPHWLVDARPETALEHSEGRRPLILRCRPDLLLPSKAGNAEGGFEKQDRAELINNFLDATVCYLAVVGPWQAQRVAKDGDQDVASPSAHVSDSLAYHADWYREFRREVRERAKAREVHFRHVLVLVCREDPPGDQFEPFQRLTEGGDDDLFDECYVMLEELEPGKKTAGEASTPLLLNAEHAWPIAVGDLLLKLLHDDPQPRGGRTVAYAWRCFPLVPTFPEKEYERLTAAQFDRLHRGLTDVETCEPNWSAAPFTRFEPQTPPDAKAELRRRDADDYSAASWLQYSPAKRLEEVRSATRWQQSLAAAGDALARNLSQQALDEEPEACRESARVWQAVHGNPRLISTALSDRRIVHGPDVATQFQAMMRLWEEILATDQRRERLIEDAEACEKDFESARDGYVNWLYRVVAASVATLFVGYISMAVFQGLLGSGYAALIAVAGGVGAFAAAMYSLDREAAAGRRAQDAFERELALIDRVTGDRHELCQEGVARSDVFCRQMQAGTAAGRLRHLLRRVQCMFDRELRSNARSVSLDRLEAEPPPESSGNSARKALSRARRQREGYRRATRLGQAIDVDELDGIRRDEELERFVSEQVIAFRDDVWLKFCQDHDRAQAGHLPACDLIPALRRFRDRFEKALSAKIRKLAIDRFQPEDMRRLGTHIREILDLRHYYELMSCRLLSHQTADLRGRPCPRLYVRREFDCDEMMLVLDATPMQEKPEVSPFLDELPILGFLFQEMPVQFEVGGNGKIGVASQYRTERPQDARPTVEKVRAGGKGPAQQYVSDQGDAVPRSPESTRAKDRRQKPK